MTNKKYLKRSSCIARIYWGFYETWTMHVNKRSNDSQTYTVKKNIVVWFEFSLIWKIPLMTLSVCKIKNFNHKYHLKFSNWVDIFWNQHFIKKSAFYKCSQIFYIIKFTVFYWDVLTQHKICNKMRGHMIGLQKKKKKKKKIFRNVCSVTFLECKLWKMWKIKKFILILSFCIKTNQKNWYFPESENITYLPLLLQNMHQMSDKYPWICLNKLFWLCQSSEYAWPS